MRFRGRPPSQWALLAVLGQLAIRAFAGGVALFADPSGGLVGASLAPLAGTPIADFRLPGALLALLFGVCPSLAGYGIYARRRWGPAAAVGVGVALLGWIALEATLGFARPTRGLNLATAVAVLVLAGYVLTRSPSRDTDG